MANYIKINNFDIANGPGVRISIYFSGCHFHCKGCFNSETWDFAAGKPFTEAEEKEVMKLIDSPHIAGLSLLGGEIFEFNNISSVVKLAVHLKDLFPEKTIWAWTGYKIEDLLARQDNSTILLLEQIDVLIDGQFIEEQRDLTLKWKGSSNQRVIDLKKTLLKHEVILYE